MAAQTFAPANIFQRLRSNDNFQYVALMNGLFAYGLDFALLILGPGLICVVYGITVGELYAFFTFLLPIHATQGSVWWCLNSAVAIFLAINTSFNYALCILTNPGTHDSDIYALLLAEAKMNGELDALVPRQREGVDKQGALDLRERRTGTGGPTLDPDYAQPAPASVSWIDSGDFEWGHCRRTKVRKAPRAHYDHITRKLVLNMDHFCPWMFNVVGYANYRYFVSFLLYVLLACVYGLFLTVAPFIGYAREDHALGRRFDLGGKVLDARSAVMYTFLLAISIGFAVGLLFFWHVYLIITAQTTIEFYGNQTRAYRARLRGLRYRNPYDLGNALKNWQQVFGHMHPLLSVLPSARRPPMPPWPRPDAPPLSLHVV